MLKKNKKNNYKNNRRYFDFAKLEEQIIRDNMTIKEKIKLGITNLKLDIIVLRKHFQREESIIKIRKSLAR
jgi:hypothetical protein